MTGEPSQIRVTFTGTGGGFLLFCLTRIPWIVLTLGLYLFYLPTAKRRWQYKHTFFDGVPMIYSTHFGHWLWDLIVDGVLMALTLGLYLPWSFAGNSRYLKEHSRLEDGRRFAFRGKGSEVILLTILRVIVAPLTGFVALPFIEHLWKQWAWKKTLLTELPGADPNAPGTSLLDLEYTDTLGEVAGRYIIDYVLTVLTLGLWYPWAAANAMRAEARAIEVVAAFSVEDGA